MADITIRISGRALKIFGGLASLVCALLLLYGLGSAGAFRPKYNLKMYVANANDISVGAPVKLDGIQVGTVEAIELADASTSPQRKIQLTLRIERRYQEMIRGDSRANLLVDGLLGPRYVGISRGFSGPALSESAEITSPPVPTNTLTLSDFSRALSKAVDRAKNSTDSGHRNSNPQTVTPHPQN